MLRLALPPDEDAEEAVTVAVAARRLGVDEATVRAMVRNGVLDGFKVGKGREPGGVRVEAASIRAYKARHRIAGAPANDGGKRRRPVSGSDDADTMRWLRTRGIIP